jgi:hypothetical protein
MQSSLVKSVSVPDFLDHDITALEVKLNSVITRPQSISSGQLTAQGLGAAHARPILQPPKDPRHAPVYGRRQSFDLP